MVINDVVEWIITIGFGAVGAIFLYVFNRINSTRDELNQHQQETERRLGEFIRREELDKVLERYENRIDKQITELKELIKEWMSKHDN